MIETDPMERRVPRLSQAIDVNVRHASPATPISEELVSVIIPVRNNQSGIDRILEAILDPAMPIFPREIIVVDNRSTMPVVVSERHAGKETPVRLLSCSKPGAAAARNIGAASARGDWLLFIDSDCIPTQTYLSAYLSVRADAIAYAGHVKSIPATRLSRFYDTEESLLPRLKVNTAGESVPLYLVTANALVWKPAFEACGGFSEEFLSAGGEDVELSIRLWQFGCIERNLGSVVLHDFSDGTFGLWKRFARYGRGNGALERVAGLTMKPRWSRPRGQGFYNWWLKMIQHGALCYGYYTTRRRSNHTYGVAS